MGTGPLWHTRTVIADVNYHAPALALRRDPYLAPCRATLRLDRLRSVAAQIRQNAVQLVAVGINP
jgi:hypothetical protein